MNSGGASGKGAPAWLGLLYDHYGHCTFEAHALRGLGLVTASDDCHAKRIEDARRMRLFDIDPGNRSLVVEKPRGGEAALPAGHEERRRAVVLGLVHVRGDVVAQQEPERDGEPQRARQLAP